MPLLISSRRALLCSRGFSPADLSGLALWLKADAGLYQERTGASATTPAAADTDPVGSWLDQSDNARHVTAGSDAVRPSLKLATFGGRNVVRSDGTDDKLTRTGLGHTTFTLALAVKMAAPASQSHLIGEYKTTGNQRAWRLVAEPGGYRAQVSADGSTASLTTALSVSAGGDVVVLAYTGTQAKVWRNGGAPQTVTVGLFAATAALSLFDGEDFSQPTSADFGDVVLYNSSLTLSNVDRLGGWLAQRYGLTWSAAS